MRKLFSMQTLLLALLVFLAPAASRAQVSVGVSVHVGPPALPVYEQPPCPVEGYLWTPGYWAYGHHGYSRRREGTGEGQSSAGQEGGCAQDRVSTAD